MRLLRASVALTAVAMVFGTAAACANDGNKDGGSEAPITLSFGSPDFATNEGTDAVAEFERRVEMLSEGDMDLEVVWQVAGEARAWDQGEAEKVLDGELDLALIPARAYDTMGVTSLQALEAPFLITDDELLNDVTAGPLATQMLAGLEDIGLVGLALIPEGLRHPVGLGQQPLLGLVDYVGATIRAPRSAATYDLLRALGAEPVDLNGAELTEAFDRGDIRGMESSLGPPLPQAAVVTANVVFFAKANTLVISADMLGSLTEAQAEILRSAAAATGEHVRRTRAGIAELARGACEQGSAIVLATDQQIAGLTAAAHPITQALQRDPLTKAAIDEISSLKSTMTPALPPTPCAPAAIGEPTAPPGDPSVLNGTWRTETTIEEGIAAGLPEAAAKQELGVSTIVMSDGDFVWGWTSDYNSHRCTGTYTVHAAVVTFENKTGCTGSPWTADYTLVGDTIEWSNVTTPVGDSETRLLNEVLYLHPWVPVE